MKEIKTCNLCENWDGSECAILGVKDDNEATNCELYDLGQTIEYIEDMQ